MAGCVSVPVVCMQVYILVQHLVVSYKMYMAPLQQPGRNNPQVLVTTGFSSSQEILKFLVKTSTL